MQEFSIRHGRISVRPSHARAAGRIGNEGGVDHRVEPGDDDLGRRLNPVTKDQCLHCLIRMCLTASSTVGMGSEWERLKISWQNRWTETRRLRSHNLSASRFAPTLGPAEEQGTRRDEEYSRRAYRPSFSADPGADQCAGPGIAGDCDADDRPSRAGIRRARAGGRRRHEAGLPDRRHRRRSTRLPGPGHGRRRCPTHCRRATR